MEFVNLRVGLFWTFIKFVDSVAVSNSGYIGECNVNIIHH